MGDELHRSLIESIQDRSTPSVARKNLADYFKRRHYTLQHKKYKVLLRWAHNALTAEYLERIGHEATFKYGKIEYDMENAMNRFERLDGEDDFIAASSWPRPNTKAKEGGSLYVENTDIEPASSIRMDDVEIYLRQATYNQKVSKLMNKFLARLKWMPLQKRWEIFQEAIEKYNIIKEQNLNEQLVKSRAEEVYGQSNMDIKDELKNIVEDYHYYKYKAKIQSKADSILLSQKSDHEYAPIMIDNSLELKLQILDKSLTYGIYGDIELDQGYSFAYQITIFFPTYFQKQIIKSQFTLYDAFAGDSQDQNIVQKRNLSSMAKIDTNIFRDISTTKNNVPTQESLTYDIGFSKLKVVRLKSCASWIDYVCMTPTIPPYLQKQSAFLSINNPIDSLLKSALNFLDVSDLATVNRILEETARLHQSSQRQRTINNNQQYQSQNTKSKNKKQQYQTKSDFFVQDNKNKTNTADADNNMQNDVKNLKDHFTGALKGEVSQQQKDNLKNIPLVGKNSLRYLPQHLIHAFYILRHMKARDYKIQLMYTLNYFRGVQKRLMLDLREFGTRERIMGDQVQPIIPSDEATKVSQQNANASYFKRQEFKQFNSSAANNNNNEQQSSFDSMNYQQKIENDFQQDKTISIFEDGQLKMEQNLVDLKKFKFKGKFNNKIYSTCPIIPRFHATFGEPIEFQPLNVEIERVGLIKHATDESIKLMGRIDHIEIDEEAKEVYLKDDFGVYILYDCVFQDLKDLEDELLKVGSFYISKHEQLINTELEKPYPLIDRITLTEELLEKESTFQFNKVLLIQNYLECYEHINDPLEQQRLIQIITDLMAQRPRLNLQSPYFKDSYEGEIKCLVKHQELVKELIQTQMLIEKEENKRVQAYLDLTYRIANEHAKGKWAYSDAEDFFVELKKRKATMNQFNGANKKLSDNQISQEQLNQSKDASVEDTPQIVDEENMSPTKRFLTRISKNQYNAQLQHEIKLTTNNAYQDFADKHPKQDMVNNMQSENAFAAVLGLPPITVETLYMQYKEKDEVILDIMNEHSNYIKVYEGYPDPFHDLQGNSTSKLQNLKVSPWSLPINILDFYESLGFITKFYASIQSILTELKDVLKPHNDALLTSIEMTILEKARDEFRKTKEILEGCSEQREYKGSQFVEDETIVGNSDKMLFYIKDFVQHLQKCLKQNINPFYIGKLDIETINFFDFPSISKDSNPFKYQKPQIKEDVDTVVKISESNSKIASSNYQRFFPQLKEYMRKINAPSMLILYCNVIELLRLRQEIIYAASESSLLQEVYEHQCKLVNRQNYKTMFNDSIKQLQSINIQILFSFDNYLIDQNKTNFIDDGAVTFLDIQLAINEFDPLLKSNLNFRNADSFKMLVCSSGIEELRAVLHYQLMQKQLLTIGTRMNQLLIDTHQRALSELELVRKGYSLPNMIIKLQNILSRSGDGFSSDGYAKEKQKFTSNMVNEAAQVFYQVNNRKTKLRNTASKKFSVFLTSVTSAQGKVECALRVLRAYKIKLLHSYCKEVLKEAYHDAQKIQAISCCQKLRTFSQIFQIDEVLSGIGTQQQQAEKAQIFKYEATEYYENYFASYNPQYIFENAGQHVFSKDSMNLQMNAVISQEKIEILDYTTIPSTISLAQCETITLEEIRHLQIKSPSFDFRANPDDNDVELSIKEFIPSVTEIAVQDSQKEDKERTSIRFANFAESYDYSNSLFGMIYTYYALIEKILSIEYFISKMSSNLLDVLNMENCILNGIPFWGLNLKEEMSKQFDSNELQKNEQLAQKILNKIANEKRARLNLADDILTLSQSLNQILQKIQNNHAQQNQIIGISSGALMNKQKCLDYLILKHEFKYYFMIHTIEKLIDNYYQKGSTKEVKMLSDSYLKLVNRDHITITFKHSAFHVNGAIVRPQLYSLDSSNISYFNQTSEERNCFQTCLHPIINEQAINPPQITLFEGMFSAPRFRATQYAGQIPHTPFLYASLETALINFSDQERSYANSTAHSIKGFLKDYLEIMHQEQTIEDVFDEVQLRKCKRFLCDLISARQLKNAMICWLSNSTLPLDSQVYSQYFQLYKNEIFWKIMNYKDSMVTHLPVQKLSSSGSKLEEITDKQKDQKYALNQQLKSLQTQVLIDQVNTCKAELIVLAREVENQLVKAAIQVVSDDSAALANCFSLTSKQLEFYVHPFQQFASTQYSSVDRNSHLDMVVKIAEIQKFITKLRNRGTEVETLTSGPGMVFTVKDFNECLQMLCRSLIKYSEKEMRARSEDIIKKEAHYIQLIYVKDRQIQNLEERIHNTRENLDKLINSKMYEKGNQLIYELDCVNRQLRLFKDNVFLMEKELKSNILSELADNLRQTQKDIEQAKNKFKDFKDHVTTQVKADLSQEQSKIEKVLKKKAEEYKNLSSSNTNKPHIRAMYANQQLALSNPNAMNFGNPNQQNILHSHTNDNLYSPEQKELNQMSEMEARSELAQMCELMRKLRIFWKMKETIVVEKYEREIFTMKKSMTSNACLWEQLAEAEKREKVLKQELVFTQQSLAASEKVIEKLKDDLRKSESDRIRLNQYKSNKAQRLEELEGKVRKFEVLENINLEKLIDTLGSKEKELTRLKEGEKMYNSRIDAVEKKKDQELKYVKNQAQKESFMKKDVLERLEGLRMELKMLEKNEGSMAEVWKTKCKELVEISNNLKNENDTLRIKLTNIVTTLNQQQQQENTNEASMLENSDYNYQSKGQVGSGLGQSQYVQLPKLMQNSSMSKVNYNFNQQKYGQLASANQSRHSSVIRNDMNFAVSAVDKSVEVSVHDQSYPAQKQQQQHNRGKSLYETNSLISSQQKQTTERQSKQRSQVSQNPNSNSNMAAGKKNTEIFAVFGQKQQQQFKGFQSVRSSQVGQNLQLGGALKMNNDLNQIINPSLNKSNILDLSNTSTSGYTKLQGSHFISHNINNMSKSPYDNSLRVSKNDQEGQYQQFLSRRTSNNDVITAKISDSYELSPLRISQFGPHNQSTAEKDQHQQMQISSELAVKTLRNDEKDSMGNISAFKGSAASQLKQE